MNEHSIGKTIANLRKSKGWTQVELAEKLMVSDKAISKWESEAGFPEISQLPVMAKLFNVTIDYLMTGKIPTKEIVTISKAELCAKNDDVKLAEEVINLPNDENNKNIVDYILQYQSIHVFKKLCEIDVNFIERFKLLDAITLAVVSNSLSLLSGKRFGIDRGSIFTFENEDEIKALLPLEDKEYFRNYNEKCVCILPRDFFTMIVTDKRINEQTLNRLFSPQNGRKCVWYHAFPYLIDEAYKNGNIKLLRKIVDISKNNNTIAYETIQPTDRYGYVDRDNYALNYYFIYARYGNKSHGLVRILESTIKSALAKGDFECANELNNINKDVLSFIKSKFHGGFSDSSKCYVASDDEIRIAKLKLDKSISDMELKIQSAIHNGVLNVSELLTIHDFKAIKKALYQYPIHIIELLYNIKKQGRRELFKFAVDINDTGLANMVLDNSLDEQSQTNMGSYYAETQFDHVLITYWEKDRKDNYASRVKTTSDMLNSLQEQRARIIAELSLKLDKEKVVGELTKEYFENELAKGNIEIVIVKLCVRMEAILRCDYHYEGDFSEMLTKYCNTFNTYDDEGNDYDPYTPEMLHKLRRKRNGIVHSEKDKETFSIDDIKWCIDYICKLG